MKIVVFHTKKYDKEFLTKYNQGFELVFVEDKLSMTLGKDKIKKIVNEADAVSVFVNCDVNKEVINILAKQNVKLILTRSAGFNHIDYKYANKKKIKVARVPKYSPYAVAEHAVALMLAVVRKTHIAYLNQQVNNFALDNLLGFDIYGKTIGVLGLGEIGMIFTQIISGFGTKVIACSPEYDKKWAKKHNVEIVSQDQVFKRSDIISLHTPLLKSTRHIINKDSIAMMKTNAIIINTSRGALVNTKDLIKALEGNKLYGVGLDVYENEKEYFFENVGWDNVSDPLLLKLIQNPKVVLSPHSAFFTTEALTAIAKTTINNAKEFKEHQKLTNEVK